MMSLICSLFQNTINEAHHVSRYALDSAATLVSSISTPIFHQIGECACCLSPQQFPIVLPMDPILIISI